MFTVQIAEPMLRIPRPQTRGDCLEEARPCPWWGCRNHLGFEVARAKPRTGRDARATSLRLNHQQEGMGRRVGLVSSAAASLVRSWMDDAMEHLQQMPYSCVLDVVQDHPDGLSDRGIALVFGVTAQRIQVERNEAEIKLKSGLEALGIDDASAWDR